MRCVNVLLEFGADANAISITGYTALHRCCFYGTLECLEALLGKNLPKGIQAPTLNDNHVYEVKEEDKVTPYLPIFSATVRDCFWIFEYVMENENELL